jgi:hypothetical protein
MGDRLMVEATPDGVAEYLHFDDAARTFTVERRADVEPAIDANKRAAALNDGYSPSRELRRVASIPVTVQMQWIQRFGGDPLAKGNERWLRRLLNDPEWRHLRTSPGKV